MLPFELNYSLHYTSEIDYEEYGINNVVITFCPIDYWDKHECLPDYYFSDEIDDALLPDGYKWLPFHEECLWLSKKTKEETRSDLNALGFVERPELEEFLTGCMG